jgi:hypothetical protein
MLLRGAEHSVQVHPYRSLGGQDDRVAMCRTQDFATPRHPQLGVRPSQPASQMPAPPSFGPPPTFDAGAKRSRPVLEPPDNLSTPLLDCQHTMAIALRYAGRCSANTITVARSAWSKCRPEFHTKDRDQPETCHMQIAWT